MSIKIELNQYSAEDVKLINELKEFGLPDEFIQKAYDETQKRRVENDCSGCVYEDADGLTTAISNCVCCSRNVEFAKNDYYVKK